MFSKFTDVIVSRAASDSGLIFHYIEDFSVRDRIYLSKEFAGEFAECWSNCFKMERFFPVANTGLRCFDVFAWRSVPVLVRVPDHFVFRIPSEAQIVSAPTIVQEWEGDLCRLIETGESGVIRFVYQDMLCSINHNGESELLPVRSFDLIANRDDFTELILFKPH